MSERGVACDQKVQRSLHTKMAWFGGVRSFHSTCLKSYAHALASLPDVSLDKVSQNFIAFELAYSNVELLFIQCKVQKLIGFCPVVNDSEPCILHDRALSAVVALGLFAVQTELKVKVKS